MDRRRLGQLGEALWAAGVAWMLALLVVSFYPPPHRDTAPPSLGVIPAFSVQYLDNRPTKLFFGTFFFLGAGCAYLVSRFNFTRGLNNPATWVGIGLFVPTASRYTAHVFSRQGSGWAALAAWACLLAPAAVTAVWAGARALLRKGAAPDTLPASPLAAGEPAVAATAMPRSRLPRMAMDLLAAALIAVLLVPSSVGTAAARVGLNCHPVFYFIGPALYRYGDRLAPGPDYFSQYGVAPGCVFSFLLRENAQATVENYIWLCVALCGLFFFSLYLVLRRPLGRMWSLGVVLFTLILLFATNAAFLCPSSWVIRFPLLPVFVGLLAHAVRHPGNPWAVVWTGACVGLSIFWNTETGLSMLCAGSLVFLVHDGSCARRVFGPLAFALSALLTVLIACALAFQEKTWPVVSEMLRPLWIHGCGYAGIPLDWDLGWNRIYAVAFPLLGIATVGWGLSELRGWDQTRRATALFPLVFALVGLCFLVKWINRSFQVVWMQNAVPLVVVAGWWLRRACRAVGEGQTGWGLRRCLAVGLTGACVVLAGAYLYVVKDPRWDQPLAARAFWEHPSVAKALLTGSHFDGWPAGLGHVSDKDIALIRRLTSPHERVALVSPEDWVYLLAAQRAPKLEIMPGTLLFLSCEANRSFAGVDLLFVETDGRGTPRLPPDWPMTFPVWTYASSLLAEGFDLEASGERLVAYRRRLPRAVATRP